MQPSATVIVQDFVSVFVFTHVCRSRTDSLASVCSTFSLFLCFAPLLLDSLSFHSFFFPSFSLSTFLYSTHCPSVFIAYIRLLGGIQCAISTVCSSGAGVARLTPKYRRLFPRCSLPFDRRRPVPVVLFCCCYSLFSFLSLSFTLPLPPLLVMVMVCSSSVCLAS